MARKIYGVFTTILVCISIFLVVALVGVRLFGIDIYSVLSGSMEPAISTGDLVYVKSTKPENVKEGDVITFSIDNETVATHRVVEVINKNENYSFRTKGDANQVEDNKLVTSQNLVGKVLFHIPKFGLILDKIRTGTGRIISIAIGGIVVLLIVLQDVFFPPEKKQEKNAHVSKSKTDADYV